MLGESNILSLVPGMNQGYEEFGCQKVGSRFSCEVPGMERFSQDIPEAARRENLLWKQDGCVCRICSGRMS